MVVRCVVVHAAESAWGPGAGAGPIRGARERGGGGRDSREGARAAPGATLVPSPVTAPSRLRVHPLPVPEVPRRELRRTPRPVTVVGLGADGWAGLTAAARSALATAEVLIGGPRQLDLL